MFTFLSPKTAVAAPIKLGPDCVSCGLATKCRHPKQRPESTSKVVIVVDAPEDRKDGLQYGEKLIETLSKHNYSIRNCVVVPASACAGDNPESWKHCQPLLVENLQAIKPETIILLGKNATASVIDYLWQHPAEMPDRWYGRRIPSRQLNAWVYPIGRAGVKKNPTVSQIQYFRWLRYALRSQGRPFQNDIPDYASMVGTPRQHEYIKRDLLAASQSTFSAFDYETNHLKATKPGAKVYSASVAWYENETPKCVAFMMVPELVEAWKGYLASDSYKIAANLKFEDRWTRHHYGMEVNRWVWDTMISAHMADPQILVSGLKFQAFTELGQPFYAGAMEHLFQTETSDGFNSIHKADPNDLLKYNGIDAIAELDLGIQQMYLAGKQTKFWSTTLPDRRYYQAGVLGC